ncbi:MAG TPA: hypothetical protein VFW87_18080 [Pirellulales bacterium]|nr:hypothetical protein [Pirellulales bacterium]
MSIESTTRDVLNTLQPGDRIEVVHQVKVGLKIWHTRTTGTVEHVRRRRHGLHFRRHYDDKVFSDEVKLRLDDGSLTTVSIDEFSELHKLTSPVGA